MCLGHWLLIFGWFLGNSMVPLDTITGHEQGNGSELVRPSLIFGWLLQWRMLLVLRIQQGRGGCRGCFKVSLIGHVCIWSCECSVPDLANLRGLTCRDGVASQLSWLYPVSGVYASPHGAVPYMAPFKYPQAVNKLTGLVCTSALCPQDVLVS